ncbi:MAG: hypothetical protein EA377_10960 [Phycisphaerales bacterium]|nr:MAG: hypothetical protein EA377_10960 [Phycisphaerales bacterium]
MNAKDILAILKRHVLIVIFSVVILASLISIPLVVSSMNTDVREQVERRAQRINELSSLERNNISFPQALQLESEQGVINEQLVQQLREYMEIESRDAEGVYELAVSRNQGDHRPLMGQVFPQMPSDLAEVLPRRFHDRIVESYDELMQRLGAGSPPDAGELREELMRERARFMTQYLAKDPDESLNDEERQQLRDRLAALRLQRYHEQAESIRVYLDRSALDIPERASGSLPSSAEMFEWQWRYWIYSDVLEAVITSFQEESDGIVLFSPVKRILSLQVTGAPQVGQSESGEGGSPGRGGGAVDGGSAMGGGGRQVGAGAVGGGGRQGGGRGASPGPAGDDPEQAEATSPDPTREVSRKYDQSITGRRPNQLYNVRYIQLEAIVETERIPDVINALARHNFMTTIDLSVQAVDVYTQMRGGYVFGDEPVSRVTFLIESLWFHEWMREWMPTAVQRRDADGG